MEPAEQSPTPAATETPSERDLLEAPADALAREWQPDGMGRGNAAGSPNVLVILVDDQPNSLFTREVMPNLFQRVVDQGASFSRAYVNQAECCPSRATILTGLFAHNTRVDSNSAPLLRADLARPTFVQRLQAAGYQTMLAGKYLNSESCEPRPGWDRWVCGDYSRLSLPKLSVDGQKVETRASPVGIAEYVKGFLDSRRGSGQPWFILYSPRSPHLPGSFGGDDQVSVPFPEPPSFNFVGDPMSRPSFGRLPPLTEREIEQFRGDYRVMARSLVRLDRSIGEILDTLGPEIDNTLVLYLNDNGFQFGEHRLRAKPYAYEESSRVPFALRYPPLVPPDQPVQSDALISNADVAPTALEVAGLPWASDGVSLASLLQGVPGARRDAVLIEACQGGNRPCDFSDPGSTPPFWGIKTDQYAYTEYITGETELYDLQVDPYELVNLAADASMAPVRAELADRLQAVRAEPAEPRTTIAVGPVGDANPSSVLFEFFAISPSTTFECSLAPSDALNDWQPCPTGRARYDGLAPGWYRFQVRATDAAGVLETSPVEWTFGVGPGQ